ncbi:MAG: hypothetical protein ABIB97_04685 [Patescibacteria group bacterium]
MCRLLIVNIMLLVLLGCRSPLGEGLDLTLEDYYELSVGCFAEIKLRHYVVYRNPGKEVVGQIKNLRRDSFGLMVSPEGRIETHRQEWIKVWIYDGEKIVPLVLYDQDLDRLKLLVPRDK